MPFWNTNTLETQQADVERLIAALDPNTAPSYPLIKSRAKTLEEFAEFSYALRQPHMHRLFVTTARRARQTKRRDLATALEQSAQELKHQFDFHAVDGARQSADRLTKAFMAGIVEFVDRPEIGEAIRVAEFAIHAASLHLKDVHDGIWESGDWFTAAEALRVACHTLEIIELAYVGDGRASGAMGSAVATANADVAVQRAAQEHVRWLERAAVAA